ncbi:hypothetical protein [uncultured Sphingomonas sp.]|nr:hypothetical protein [uncultured Sphingomonas sp.]
MLPLLLSRHLSDRALGLAMGISIGLSLVALGCYARTLAGERKR